MVWCVIIIAPKGLFRLTLSLTLSRQWGGNQVTFVLYNKFEMVGVGIEQILRQLSDKYGKREWQPGQGPISVLVQTILSQNTSDRNSGRAFESLLISFCDWDDIADAGVGQIADSIRAGGLGEVKAGYIKRVLEDIRRKQGGFELEFLKRMSVDEARDWLKQLPGVGMKTASCVLLFALGMPALPVDTHIFRVARRLELIDSKVSVEQAHKLLEGLVPPDGVYQFHVLMIEHGRQVCKARQPRCGQCVLMGLCPSNWCSGEALTSPSTTLKVRGYM